MREILKLGFILFIVCLISALFLSCTYVFTEKRIEVRELSDIENALKEVMPDSGVFEKITQDGFTYYYAYDSKRESRGYVVTAEGKGYAGPIITMVGVDVNGIIKGIKVLEQKETPGLGVKILEDNFILQFLGQNGRRIEVSKEKGRDKIMAITGATISTTAMTESIKQSVEKLFEIVGKTE